MADRKHVIASGWIATEKARALVESDTCSTGLISRTAMERREASENLAGRVQILCSEGSGFVIGTVIPVDGGYLSA